MSREPDTSTKHHDNIGYAIRSPEAWGGRISLTSISPYKKNAIKNLERDYDETWRSLYAKGFRVIKIKVVPHDSND